MSKAWNNAINGEQKVDRESILKEIARSIATQHSYSTGYSGNDWTKATENRNAAITEMHRRNQLKELLSLADQGGMNSGSGSSWSNPFGGAGGASGSGGGAPQFSNADNRFATGLTDAELRIKNLLDNPDSINQSAAYKFRVGQGQEALQRALGAKGMLNSGNRLTELTKYGQDMASQEYDNQYNRLGSLLGNYSQGYAADKNSNVNLYGQQANAWNQAQANQDRVNIANQEIWSKRTPVDIPGIAGGKRWV